MSTINTYKFSCDININLYLQVKYTSETTQIQIIFEIINTCNYQINTENSHNNSFSSNIS